MHFEIWDRSHKHPFAIYADFESIIEKENDTNITNNTKIIHHHDIMSFCYYVKPDDDIPTYLLEEFNIETDSVIFRGDFTFGRGNVDKNFTEEIVQFTLKIENILNVNIPRIMNDMNEDNYENIIAKGT
jgi:hypothetical protein